MKTYLVELANIGRPKESRLPFNSKTDAAFLINFTPWFRLMVECSQLFYSSVVSFFVFTLHDMKLLLQMQLYCEPFANEIELFVVPCFLYRHQYILRLCIIVTVCL